MKTLLLIRHAKTSLGTAEISDFDRPLTPQGEQEIENLAEQLKIQQILPEHVMASPALRAMTTAMRLTAAFNYASDSILLEKKIYEAELSTLVDILQNLNTSWQSVWLIGHNPGMTELCNYLSSESLPELPTTGAVHFKLPIDNWSELAPKQGVVLSKFHF